MHLRRQLSIVRHRLPLLIGAVLVSAAGAFLVSGLQPRVYEASATLLVGQTLTAANTDYNQLLVSQRLSATYATVATTRPVLERVIERLGINETPAVLNQRITATAATDGALLTITARDGDPQQAAQIANTLAEELIAASPAVQGQQSEVLESVEEDIAAIQDDIRVTQDEIEALTAIDSRTAAQDARLDTLRARVVSLRSTFATLLSFAPTSASNLLTIIQPAVAPGTPIAPRPSLNAALAGVLAFLIVSAIVFVIEYLDDAIKDPAEVEEEIGLPTLASIERMTGGKERAPIYRLAALLYPRSPAAEAYRGLRTNIEFAAVDRPIQTLLVTSAVPGEGKTVTAANLAVVFAQGGRRVLLVDADLRKPGVHEMFALNNDFGLTDLLRSDGLSLSSLTRPTEQTNLEVMTAGRHPPNPAELLASQRMRALLPILAKEYDLVVFDSPPLDVFADSAVLSSFIDGSILVVEARRGRRAQVRAAREALSKASASILGVVLNGLTQRSPTEYGRYYGAPNERASTKSAAISPIPQGGQDAASSGFEQR